MSHLKEKRYKEITGAVSNFALKTIPGGVDFQHYFPMNKVYFSQTNESRVLINFKVPPMTSF